MSYEENVYTYSCILKLLYTLNKLVDQVVYQDKLIVHCGSVTRMNITIVELLYFRKYSFIHVHVCLSC